MYYKQEAIRLLTACFAEAMQTGEAKLGSAMETRIEMFVDYVITAAREDPYGDEE